MWLLFVLCLVASLIVMRVNKCWYLLLFFLLLLFSRIVCLVVSLGFGLVFRDL